MASRPGTEVDAMARPFWLTKLLVQSGLARLLPFARRLADGGTDCLHYYSDQVLAAPVEELLDPAHFPVAGPEAIDLNLAAPRFESSVSLGRVTADRRGNPPPWGLPELRRSIAEFEFRRDARIVDAEREVFVTHGATAAFASVLDAFVNPGDRVVLFDPCSPLFSLGARSRRADVHWVPVRNENGECRFNTRVFEKAMRRAKLLVLANPANPTGACLTPEDLESIARIAVKRDVIVFADESFPCTDALARFPSQLPGFRLLTSGSVSQRWGLGSLRVGWLTGPRHLVKACALMANLHAPYVPTICQQIAASAIETSPPAEPSCEKRRFVLDRLRMLGFDPDPPAGGYFVWVNVAGLSLTGRTFAERLLKEQRVLVGPGCAFGPSGANYVRISFAAEDGRLREGLARLASFVRSLRGEPAWVEPAAAEPILAESQAPVFSRV